MRAWKVLISVSLLGLAGCEFFYPTTVPGSDGSNPWAVVSLYYDGDHHEMRAGEMSLSEASSGAVFNLGTTDPYKAYVALAAGVDSGGVHEVRMHSRVVARCVYGAANVHVLEPWAQQTVTQSGSVGDTVDNGLYVPKAFRGIDYVSSLDFCPDDNYRVTLEWYSRAEDFHGNATYQGLGRVTYFQWAS